MDGRRIVVGSPTTESRQLGELNAAIYKMNDDGMALLARGRLPAAHRSGTPPIARWR